MGDSRADGEERLGRILTFFGVPWTEVSVGNAMDAADGSQPYAVFAARHVWEAAGSHPAAANLVRGAATAFVFDAGEDAAPAPVPAVAEVSARHDDVTGPMSGLRVALDGPAGPVLRLATVVAGASDATPIVSVGGAPVFALVSCHGAPVYVCASGVDIDLDAPVAGNYYDVKSQFVSAVPLVMFITWAFREVMWRPRELGACLIIDDPLLKHRYGFCDFPHIGELMRQHRFTTNIAFIPWNWRRTSSRGGDFFRSEASRFSVSIHGCDHTAAEFGTTSIARLAQSASTAQARMARHRERTRIEHEPVMVFPQGVFSSPCPDVLKRHGFIAAVNTEVGPVDRAETTTVGDVWDVAILRYGAFPIYTRRYAFHGIENFAFDMLLGKPCFIVAHHDFFSDRGARLVALVDQLSSRGRALEWRSPGEVVRRAYRRRRDADGVEQVEMYGGELQLENDGEGELNVRVSKREPSQEVVAAVESIPDAGERRSLAFSSMGGSVTFADRLPAKSTRRYGVRYQAPARPDAPASLKYEMHVAARRLLSEFRDEWVQPTRFRVRPS
jgi:hypothetical protein